MHDRDAMAQTAERRLLTLWTRVRAGPAWFLWDRVSKLKPYCLLQHMAIKWLCLMAKESKQSVTILLYITVTCKVLLNWLQRKFGELCTNRSSRLTLRATRRLPCFKKPISKNVFQSFSEVTLPSTTFWFVAEWIWRSVTFVESKSSMHSFLCR